MLICNLPEELSGRRGARNFLTSQQLRPQTDDHPSAISKFSPSIPTSKIVLNIQFQSIRQFKSAVAPWNREEEMSISFLPDSTFCQRAREMCRHFTAVFN